MKLDVKKIEQEDNECGPAAAAQVLNYFGIEPNMRDIVEKCSNSFKFRDWDYQIALYLLNQGLSITINTFHSFTIDPSWFNLPMDQLSKKLVQVLKFLYSNSPRLKTKDYTAWHNIDVEISEIESALRFINKGGLITFSPISFELIKKQLDDGNPIICAYDAILLHGMKRGFRGKPDDIGGVPLGHMAVISGYENRDFYLVDPSYWYRKEEVYKVSSDRLINTILIRDPNIIICSR